MREMDVDTKQSFYSRCYPWLISLKQEGKCWMLKWPSLPCPFNRNFEECRDPVYGVSVCPVCHQCTQCKLSVYVQCTLGTLSLGLGRDNGLGKVGVYYTALRPWVMGASKTFLSFWSMNPQYTRFRFRTSGLIIHGLNSDTEQESGRVLLRK